MASKGWTWRWQRRGRYEYRKVLMPPPTRTTRFPARPVGAAGYSGWLPGTHGEEAMQYHQVRILCASGKDLERRQVPDRCKQAIATYRSLE